MNESCHTYKWVMWHIWMSHVTHTNESCDTYEWVMSHIQMSHVTHMNESCHTYKWGMTQVKSIEDEMHLFEDVEFTSMNESWHTDEWVVSHICMNESCHTYEWVMAHRWVGCVTQVVSHICIWMSHMHEWRICMNESCHTYAWVMAHEWAMSYVCMSHGTRGGHSKQSAFVGGRWADWCEWVMSHR